MTSKIERITFGIGDQTFTVFDDRPKPEKPRRVPQVTLHMMGTDPASRAQIFIDDEPVVTDGSLRAANEAMAKALQPGDTYTLISPDGRRRAIAKLRTAHERRAGVSAVVRHLEPTEEGSEP